MASKLKKKKKDQDLVTLTVYMTDRMKKKVRKGAADANQSMTDYVQGLLSRVLKVN